MASGTGEAGATIDAGRGAGCPRPATAGGRAAAGKAGMKGEKGEPRRGLGMGNRGGRPSAVGVGCPGLPGRDARGSGARGGHVHGGRAGTALAAGRDRAAPAPARRDR